MLFILEPPHIVLLTLNRSIEFALALSRTSSLLRPQERILPFTWFAMLASKHCRLWEACVSLKALCLVPCAQPCCIHPTSRAPRTHTRRSTQSACEPSAHTDRVRQEVHVVWPCSSSSANDFMTVGAFSPCAFMNPSSCDAGSGRPGTVVAAGAG